MSILAGRRIGEMFCAVATSQVAEDWQIAFLSVAAESLGIRLKPATDADYAVLHTVLDVSKESIK